MALAPGRGGSCSCPVLRLPGVSAARDAGAGLSEVTAPLGSWASSASFMGASLAMPHFLRHRSECVFQSCSQELPSLGAGQEIMHLGFKGFETIRAAAGDTRGVHAGLRSGVNRMGWCWVARPLERAINPHAGR